MSKLQVAVRLKMSLGESPIWDHRSNLLHWIDIHEGRIHTWNPKFSASVSSTRLPERIGCIALGSSNRFVAATDSGVWLLDNSLSQERVLAANSEWQDGAGNRFNDGAVDASGRLWVGTIDREESEPTAALYCLDGEELSRAKGGLAISNGVAFSPDGEWLYHTDSLQRKVVRHRLGIPEGAVGEAEPWIDLSQWDLPGVVDGAAVDRAGRYWCALYGGGRIACFESTGELLGTYELPCPYPTMVTFGGKDLATLFVTTARQHLTPDEAVSYPLSGSLFAMPVSVPGLQQNEFAVAES